MVVETPHGTRLARPRGVQHISMWLAHCAIDPQVASKDGYVSTVIFEEKELGPVWDMDADAEGMSLNSQSFPCCAS